MCVCLCVNETDWSISTICCKLNVYSSYNDDNMHIVFVMKLQRLAKMFDLFSRSARLASFGGAH